MKDNPGERIFDIDPELENRILKREEKNIEYASSGKNRNEQTGSDSKPKSGSLVKILFILLALYSGFVTITLIHRIFKKT